MTPKIFVALADGFEEIEAVAPLDILRRAGFDVTAVSLAGPFVAGAHGISVQANKTWEEVSETTPDVLVLPGGMPGSKNLGAHAGLALMAGRVAKSGGTLAAICAAPAFTLAAWGLLSGRRAACFPGCEGSFPADVVYSEDGVVVDGRVVTARGPGVAPDFAFALVELFAGGSAAAQLRDSMQYH